METSFGFRIWTNQSSPKASAKRTYVIVHSDEGFASILPLLTITSLTFQVDGGS